MHHHPRIPSSPHRQSETRAPGWSWSCSRYRSTAGPASRSGGSSRSGSRSGAAPRREAPAPAGEGRAAFVRSIRSMRTTQEIVESIDNRLRELNDEIQTLNAARVALDANEGRSSGRPSTGAAASHKSASSASSPTNSSGPSSGRETPAEVSRESASRSRRRPRKAPQQRARRALDTISGDRLESLLSDNGGLTTSALAEKTGGDRDQVLNLLRELETGGRIRRTGQRRATRWHKITDEDRIRERAAELEATRRRPA